MHKFSDSMGLWEIGRSQFVEPWRWVFVAVQIKTFFYITENENNYKQLNDNEVCNAMQVHVMVNSSHVDVLYKVWYCEMDVWFIKQLNYSYCHLKARRALTLFNQKENQKGTMTIDFVQW